MKDEHGRYTNALYVMCRTLDKIMAEQKPSHVAIVFDATRDTFRREIYPNYKGNRGETPEPQLISQGANAFSHLGEWHFLFAYF